MSAASAEPSSPRARVAGSRAAGSRADDHRRTFRPAVGRAEALLSLLAAPVLTVLMALVPLIHNPSFYFYADTPEGAYGQWYELGEKLLEGQWPLLSPSAWMAGNYVAEGQWGLWNPLVLLTALLVHACPDAILASTLVKLAFLAIAAVGIHLLTRDLGASPRWALVAAVTAPLAGFTLFMDATSWVTNLMVWALFPWTLWGIRRYAEGRGLLLWPALAGYLLVTIGYVQGTLMLILLYIALLGVAVVRRRWRIAGRTFLIGVVHGLVTIAVYLPGLLTSEVTRRTDTVRNDGFMVLTLSGLATGTTPFSLGDLSGWWGRFTDLPLLYIAWFLPLVLLVSGRRVRALAPRLASLWVFGGLVLVLATAPSEMGPLRYPARSLPWIALVLIVTAVVLLDRGLRRRPGEGALAGVLAWMGFSAWLVWAARPELWHAPRALSHLLLMAAGAAAVWVLARRRSGAVGRGVSRFLVPAIVLVVALGVSAMQIRTYAPLMHSRSDYPADASVYVDAVPVAQGDGIVIGNEAALMRPFSDETVYGNFWYLNADADFQNVYTPVGFAAYADDTCMEYDGVTCMELADTLASTDPTTGVPVADLLSTDTIQILADGRWSIEEIEAKEPPQGWHVAESDERSVTWVRDAETPPAGSAVWASDGTTFTQGPESDLSSTVHIDSVGPEGGTIVFSRLDWPGYTASGATISEDPVRGYLLTVDVPPDAAGTDVTVTFRPPAWRAILAAMALAGTITVAATAAQLIIARRRAAATPRAGQASAAPVDPQD